ncbi:efflux RND transporter permease subunit [Burkholderia gladioli]|uniref:efflux RND transporter permease subunit n=1 Tax=Burkholderia gladioli TaxID=28095 RepID=UPI0016408166|nr:efflux RND transporter permease subunit [Burkholderia gladioli]MBU9687310.1 efflux RND transporter permease subunit [Burkholderia gladioli]
MNFSRFFIRRPVATTLLALGIALSGLFAFVKLPVSPLPRVDFPTISVFANLPGASPATVSTSVTSPLERHLGSIAGVTQMTSTSSLGNALISLQFVLERDLNGAARDVQAAINAARADLPASLKSNPTFQKVNLADTPIMVLSVTSDIAPPSRVYDAASTVLQQALSQIEGIGEVDVFGAASPAVRVELEPHALFHYGIGLEDVRAALASANANSPKGMIEVGPNRYQLYTNDQASQASQYRDLVVAYRNNAAVRLTDVGSVIDSVEDLRNLGLANGKRAVLVILYRSPGANIIDAVDRVKAALPRLSAALPPDVDLGSVLDRSVTIRSSLADTEHTLVVAVALVVMVVFVFLRNWRATLIPTAAVPVSIIGTFGAMYVLGFSIDNLSLMALIVATGFVVDDAVVVLENIMRHIENGKPRMQAALDGAREVGFTVVSISLSLIAVFLPILLMTGLIGRLFREFAMTLSLAIAVSLVVSLTLTPMMCARLLPEAGSHRKEGRLSRWLERGFERLQSGYDRTLQWALRHRRITLLSLIATVGLNMALFVVVPKGFFPQQDTGVLIGGIQVDQSTSFQAMQLKFAEMMKIIQSDPNVLSIAGFRGGRTTNAGFMFVTLKDKQDRKLSADQIIEHLRPQLERVSGAQTFLQAAQDLGGGGGRQTNAQYQFSLYGDSPEELYKWGDKLAAALKKKPQLTDVNSDQQQGGLEAMVHIDRATAARLGITPLQIDNTLYDAFGQRQVSTIYNPLNQYHVVMELAPKYWQDPEMLKQVWISTTGGSASGVAQTNAAAGTFVAGGGSAGGAKSSASTAQAVSTDSARNAALNSIAATGKAGTSSGEAVSTSKSTMIPLSAIASFGPGTTPIAINHEGPFVAVTISFNLPPGKALSDARTVIYQTMREIGVPASINAGFSGTAEEFEKALRDQLLLIIAALAAIYIVLGILYESYIHPITILSTLPSAGVGALLALLISGTEFDIIGLIGIFLLIGIVKKNAILMIDYAVVAAREGKSSFEAIHEACRLRFRPILMTTMAALFGTLPLVFGHGDGAELRAPLGITLAGGLIVSQVLTLYTTPVVYLYMDRLRLWSERRRARRAGLPPTAGA